MTFIVDHKNVKTLGTLLLFAQMLVLLPTKSQALPRAELTTEMRAPMAAVENAKAWLTYLDQNKENFPPLDAQNRKSSVTVLKDEVKVNGDTYTVGTSYRQALIKASADRVKTLLSRPDLFQYLYGLDGESAPKSDLQPGGTLPTVFEARILKKLPSILPDQEYKLKYTSHQDEKNWFQRVELVEDKTDFALRETLVVVTETPEGTLFQEVGRVYPLQWMVRAMGPQLRSIMKTELGKMSASFACVAESTEPLDEALAKSCWEKSKNLK